MPIEFEIGSTRLPGVDVPALRRFLDGRVGGGGPLRLSLIQGGRSNLTYLMTDGISRWVLRRPPLGTLTPSAHDMSREYRVVEALGPTGVPVPRAVLCCEDTAVIGVPFTIMSYVDGIVLRDGDHAAALPADQARRCAETLVDELVRLHSLDPGQIGLDGFGRPAGYLERQVRRWHGQWGHVATRDLPAFHELHRRLALGTPAESGTSVVHGDYRLDNTIIDAADPGRMLAVVDWEMSTLGDPLADLGLLLVYWNPACEPVLGVRHAPTANAGFPAGNELAERYAERSGRDISSLAFYQALGYLKLAVIAEGIHARSLAGQTVGAGFDAVGSAVPALLQAGLDTLP
ncbi:phosphotransferase family protein [Nonomuraea sp. NPDC049480]|uniref:phosphotransferase family protein n=1 Tax=Nonomuraea sp. NPDC049480 TaxID=3364353 RepID=UPI0037A55B74